MKLKDFKFVSKFWCLNKYRLIEIDVVGNCKLPTQQLFKTKNKIGVMLYYLFEYLAENFDFPGENLYKFITFRAGFAIIISLVIALLFGKRIINYLHKLQVGETVRDLGLKGQKEKEGTPSMGGLIIILAILVPVLLLTKLNNAYILLMIFTTVWMGMIGFLDDYIKIFKKDKKGLKGKFKILGQVILGAIVGATMLWSNGITVRVDTTEAQVRNYDISKTYDLEYPINSGKEKSFSQVKTSLTNVPFMKGNEMNYTSFLPFLSAEMAKKWVWIIFIPMIIIIVTAVSNGANLTDGLDGLATGVSAIIGATLGILAYVSGNTLAADYLGILYLPESAELVIFAAAFLGATIGFLWYNAYPAQVFMGDTGSLTIGAIIATMAILLRKELLIPILCGIFLVENFSVVLQVGYFKYTKKKHGEGRRIFRMSPIHHHYQKLGIPEAKIVTRFWIVGIMLAVITIITLKIR